MPHLSRRRFLASAAVLGVPSVLPARPADRLKLAVIGVANRGAANLAGVRGENVVALCDVDPAHAVAARKEYPAAAFFTDYRKLFDAVGKTVDGVVVSTPDHSHAHPTLIALGLGKPVYSEKPLCLTVSEVRRVTEAAAAAKVPTQMGTQIHAGENYRRAVEVVQSGMLGPVRTVHVWLNGGPTPGKRTAARAKADFDLDLWQGTSAHPVFAADHKAWPHFYWRYWWEFGGGALGDFGCHYMDLPFWALGLTAPTAVAATGEVRHGGDNPLPDRMRVEYAFPAVGSRPAVALTWQHGVTGPTEGQRFKGFESGVLFVGEKASLVANYNKLRLLPDEFDEQAKRPPQSIARSVGHHKEWLDAIRTGTPTTCPFRYAGPLTEAVLLGNVAYRAGARLAWDAAKRTTGNAAADALLGREYRKGWEI